VTNNISFFFSSRRRHTRSKRDWSSDVCSSDLGGGDGSRQRSGAHARGLLLVGEQVEQFLHDEGLGTKFLNTRANTALSRWPERVHKHRGVQVRLEPTGERWCGEQTSVRLNPVRIVDVSQCPHSPEKRVSRIR